MMQDENGDGGSKGLGGERELRSVTAKGPPGPPL